MPSDSRNDDGNLIGSACRGERKPVTPMRPPLSVRNWLECWTFANGRWMTFSEYDARQDGTWNDEERFIETR